MEEVHFCNKTDDCALVCEVKSDNGLRVVDVPNILLQNAWDIRAYAYCDCATMREMRFKVIARSKPADYIYTETEIKNYADLEERVKQIEENGISDEAINDAINDYLEENPIEVDMTGYATKDYVDGAIEAIEFPTTDLSGYATENYVNDAIGAIDIPETDLSDYYTKGEIDTKTEDYATENYVDTAISNIEIPETDLTDYATKTYVAEEVAKAATGGEVDLSAYATKTYVDEAIEDIEYPEPDLSNYYTKAEVNKAIEDIPEQDLSGYALKTDIPSIEGLATENYVDEAFNAIVIPAALADLTDDTAHRTVSDAEKTEWNAKYGENNEPPYPVSSVNGKAGEVNLSYADVGALPDTTAIPSID